MAPVAETSRVELAFAGLHCSALGARPGPGRCRPCLCPCGWCPRRRCPYGQSTAHFGDAPHHLLRRFCAAARPYPARHRRADIQPPWTRDQPGCSVDLTAQYDRPRGRELVQHRSWVHFCRKPGAFAHRGWRFNPQMVAGRIRENPTAGRSVRRAGRLCHRGCRLHCRCSTGCSPPLVARRRSPCCWPGRHRRTPGQDSLICDLIQSTDRFHVLAVLKPPRLDSGTYLCPGWTINPNLALVGFVFPLSGHSSKRRIPLRSAADTTTANTPLEWDLLSHFLVTRLAAGFPSAALPSPLPSGLIPPACQRYSPGVTSPSPG